MCKVGSIKEVSAKLQRLQPARLVLALGCFDVFHIGHLEYLLGAKRLGTHLAVGVNSDASYKRIKSHDPMFQADQRMWLLANLICTDFIFSFEEDTADSAIRKLCPLVFAKGVDWKERPLPEADTLEEFKIEVVYIGETKRASSSALKETIGLY